MEAISASIDLPQHRSLAAQTARSLREGIAAGCWQQHLPGERELAKRLQVSRRTLRVALAELQQQGWIEAAPRCRSVILKRFNPQEPKMGNRVIGVLSPGSLLVQPMTFVMDALRERLMEAGLRVEFHAHRSCYSARPAAALQRLTQEHPAAAWLVLGSKAPVQQWLARHRVPCLIAGSCAAEVALPSIDVDYHAACLHAGGVLRRKGHRRVALVLPRDALGGDVASEVGLRVALKGLPDAHLRVLRHDGSAAHLRRLIDETLRAQQPPTAYLVAHTTSALTVMMHLLRREVRVPQDVSVMARDDDPALRAACPEVARYVLDPTRLVHRITRALRQLAEGGALPTEATRLMPDFVPGDTLGNARE